MDFIFGTYGNHNFLTPAEAARELRVSTATIYRLLSDGRIRAVKVGSQYRIDKREVVIHTREETPGFVSYTGHAFDAARDRRR